LLLRAITEPPRCEAPENVQAVAIRVLGEMRSRQAVELLRAVLRTGTGRLRKNAAAALGKIGDPSALPDLLEVAQNDADTSLQMDAITALGELGDPRAEPVLLKLLVEHHDSRIRYCAAGALARAGTRAAIPVLESRMDRENFVHVRSQIGWAIRELRRKAR
jgi:HEAT repeat protein